ncbi:low temperature requirement protein A [Catellatospora sp. KI3]|uniref:low temperature requirement protein A n=1 Tax=Catellatospora sp. KI3 TaxID=3041620 RepID=UPI0024832E8D|nr:low temperature requirement protein A [Catellatospora sp. KI3]MDI1466055.1 low temperature requirement protein A [Catellatospora sp. KI3]
MTDPSPEPRRADWFELFFDLVFVVTVAVLAHGLHGDPGWRDFGTFLVLLFPAWWAWVNLTLSVNLFGSDTGWNRTVLVAAMPGLGLMAAAAPEGLDGRAWVFALGAAWVRVAVFALWWPQVGRSRWEFPAWRPIVYCLVPASIWAVSAFVDGPARFALWGLAIVLEVALLAFGTAQSRVMYRLLSVEHLVERIGLFIVIVFGESVFAIVTGLSEHFTGLSAIAALAAFVVVAVLAITFFRWSTPSAERGFVRAQALGARANMREAVLYLPFLLVSAVTALAAALGTAVAEPGHHLPLGSVVGLVAGIGGYHAVSGLIAQRLGESWRSVLRWVLPSIVLPVAVVTPAALLLPGWTATLVAAAVVLALFTASKLTEQRAARAA